MNKNPEIKSLFKKIQKHHEMLNKLNIYYFYLFFFVIIN